MTQGPPSADRAGQSAGALLAQWGRADEPGAVRARRRVSRRELLVGGALVAGGAAVAAVVVLSPSGAPTKKSLHFVAHADDDLLFMNPDERRDIEAGRYVRTVYTTAGDGGFGTAYSRDREAGAMAAFAQMAGVADSWDMATLMVSGHRLDLRTLKANPRISAVFLRLPDGGARGQGFAWTGRESLQKLWSGSAHSMRAIDGSSSYTKQDLTDVIGGIVDEYQPSLVRTQDYVGTYGDGDHSDHYSTAYFVRAAHLERRLPPSALLGYLGYPSRYKAANVSGAALQEKYRAFLTYAAHDVIVPQTEASIDHTLGGAYGAWMARQWTVAGS